MPRVLGEAREGSVMIRRRRGLNVVEAPMHYIVQAESNSAQRIEVEMTPGLPLVGVTQSISLGMCVSKEAVRRSENPKIWDVTCVFSTEAEESITNVQGGSSNHGGSPTAWVPIAQLNFEKYQARFTRDYNNKLYCNSANEPIQDGLMIPLNIIRWDFFQFEVPTLTYLEISGRNDVVNEVQFLSFAPKTLLLTVNSATLGNYYGVRCWLIEYSLRYRSGTLNAAVPGGVVPVPRDWRLEVLDVGQGISADYPAGSPLDGLGGIRSAFSYPAIIQFDIYKPVDISTFIRLAALT